MDKKTFNIPDFDRKDELKDYIRKLEVIAFDLAHHDSDILRAMQIFEINDIKSRREKNTVARLAVAYMKVIKRGWTHTQTAALIQRDHSSITNAIKSTKRTIENTFDKYHDKVIEFLNCDNE